MIFEVSSINQTTLNSMKFQLTNSKSSIFLGISCGLIFLLILFISTLIFIRINKGIPLFDSISIYTNLALSFLILGIGGCVAFYFALKNNKRI
jgi:glucan phosphoethanolaminetransferase (alkaline phosphatase superfamily)